MLCNLLGQLGEGCEWMAVARNELGPVTPPERVSAEAVVLQFSSSWDLKRRSSALESSALKAGCSADGWNSPWRVSVAESESVVERAGSRVDLPGATSYHALPSLRFAAQMSDYSYCHMTLKMETHILDNVLILHCTGRLVFGDEAAAFRERIKNILLGTNQIVVNLSGIEYIDSGGLGTLVGTLASTRNRHGEIKLVRPVQRVSDLLQRTRLHTVFKSYESDDEAVAAFRDHS
jgi:anti-sigma B factor antagonist